jgi:hypothetical protein
MSSGRQPRKCWGGCGSATRESRVVFHPAAQVEVELGEFRACSLRRFPYTIFYIELENQLWLGAVAHQSRRPAYWARGRPD